MEVRAQDGLRLGGRKRKSSRRSSILKSRSPAREVPLLELDPNAPLEDDATVNTKKLRRSKRVSFSATCQVKEFIKDAHWNSTSKPAPPVQEPPKDSADSSKISGLDLLLKGPITDTQQLGLVGEPSQGHTSSRRETDRNQDVHTIDDNSTKRSFPDIYVPQRQFTMEAQDQTCHFSHENGGMDMTVCLTERICVGSGNDINTGQSNPEEKTGNLDRTKHVSEDMDLTTCGKSHEQECKIDTTAALYRLSNSHGASDNGGEHMTTDGNKSLLFHREKTQFFGDVTGQMELTVCNDDMGYNMDGIEVGKENKASLSTLKHHTLQVHTEMDPSICSKDRIDPERLDTAQALARIMCVKKMEPLAASEEANKGKLNADRMLERAPNTDNENINRTVFGNIDMDMTMCNTTSTHVSSCVDSGGTVDNEGLDTVQALTRIMSSKNVAVSGEANRGTLNADRMLEKAPNTDKENINRTVFGNINMDMTGCNTTSTHVSSCVDSGGTVDNEGLDTVQALTRIMSGKNVAALVKANRGMLDAGSVVLKAPNTDKEVMNRTVFCNSDMDMTRCNTSSKHVSSCVDSGGTADSERLDTVQALTRIMSGKSVASSGESRGKPETNIALMTSPNTDRETNRTVISNIDMDMTKCNTMSVHAAALEEMTVGKLDTDRTLEKAQNTDKEVMNRTVFCNVDMDMTRCSTSTHVSLCVDSGGIDDNKRLDTAQALTRILAGKNVAATGETSRGKADGKLRALNIDRESTNRTVLGNIDMDMTRCTTAAIDVPLHEGSQDKVDNERLDTAEALARITMSKRLPEPAKEKLQLGSVVNQTPNYTVVGDIDMDMTKCTSETIHVPSGEDNIEATINGLKKAGDRDCMQTDVSQCYTGTFNSERLNTAQALARIMSSKKVQPMNSSREMTEENIKTNTVGSSNYPVIDSVEMDMTRCHSAANEKSTIRGEQHRDVQQINDKAKMASSCSSIADTIQVLHENAPTVLSQHWESKTGHQEAHFGECTQIFTNDENSNDMEFTQCLTGNLPVIHAPSSEEWSKPPPKNTTASTYLSQMLTRTKVQLELPDSVRGLPETIKHVSQNQTVCNDKRMDITTCNSFLGDTPEGRILKDKQQKIEPSPVKTDQCKTKSMELDIRQSILKGKDKTMEQTHFFDDGEDMEFTTCFSSAHLEATQNGNRCHDSENQNTQYQCTGTGSTHSFEFLPERTLLFDQGNDDMEFTGLISDVIVSSLTQEEQMKENRPVISEETATRCPKGLQVRAGTETGLSQTGTQQTKTGISIMADNSCYESLKVGSENMDLTRISCNAPRQRSPSLSDTDSDEVFRPDDGVPIKLGSVEAPRLTEDGCIYTQATFDSSLKFINRLETLVETSRETSDVSHSTGASASTLSNGSHQELSTGSEEEPTRESHVIPEDTDEKRLCPDIGSNEPNHLQGQKAGVTQLKTFDEMTKSDSTQVSSDMGDMELTTCVTGLMKSAQSKFCKGKPYSRAGDVDKSGANIYHTDNSAVTDMTYCFEKQLQESDTIQQKGEVVSQPVNTINMNDSNNDTDLFSPLKSPAQEDNGVSLHAVNRITRERSTLDVSLQLHPHQTGIQQTPVQEGNLNPLDQSSRANICQKVTGDLAASTHLGSELRITSPISSETSEPGAISDGGKGELGVTTNLPQTFDKAEIQILKSEPSETEVTCTKMMSSLNSVGDSARATSHKKPLSTSVEFSTEDIDKDCNKTEPAIHLDAEVGDSICFKGPNDPYPFETQNKADVSSTVSTEFCNSTTVKQHIPAVEKEPLHLNVSAFKFQSPLSQDMKDGGGLLDEEMPSFMMENYDSLNLLVEKSDEGQKEMELGQTTLNKAAGERGQESLQEASSIESMPLPDENLHMMNGSVHLPVVKSKSSLPQGSLQLLDSTHSSLCLPTKPTHGSSTSQLSMVDLSHLDDCKPQTISDYLQLLNIRFSTAVPRNSTIVPQHLSISPGIVGLLEQKFLDAPKLELLQKVTFNLQDGKKRIAAAVENMERELLRNLPKVFTDIQEVDEDCQSALRKKYREMYKACSVTAKAEFKLQKCQFTTALIQKYQETLEVAEKMKCEILDKTEVVPEMIQLIDEATTELQQEVNELDEEMVMTPKQRCRLAALDDIIEELEKSSLEREEAIRKMKTDATNAAIEQQQLKDMFKERLRAILAPSCYAQADSYLALLLRLCNWRSSNHTPTHHVSTFMSQSLILQLTFECDGHTSSNIQQVQYIKLISELSENATGFASLAHHFIQSAFDQRRLDSMKRPRNKLNELLCEVAVPVAVAVDLAANMHDIELTHRVRVEQLVVIIEFSSLAAFTKFSLLVTLDPFTYPTSRPHWDIVSSIGSKRREDFVDVVQCVQPGLGYLFRMVSAIDAYLETSASSKV